MKNLMIISALMFISTSSYASVARLLALGMNETSNDGVLYIHDARNVFMNPAWVNVYSNLLVMEYGSTGLNLSADSSYATPSAATVWRSTSPKAQGGVFKKYDNYVVGAYLGNESNTSSLLRTVATSAASTMNNYVSSTNVNSKMLPTADNQLDLFFGLEQGYKYGLDLIYTDNKDDTRSLKYNSFSIRFGIIGSGWDAHLHSGLVSKTYSTDTITPLNTSALSDTVYQEFKAKLNLQVGGSYNVGAHSKIFGYYNTTSWEQIDSYSKYTTFHTAGAASGLGVSGQQGTVKGDYSSYYIGWGDQMPVENGDNIFVSVAAKKTDINIKFTNKTQVRHVVIPLTIGYEGKVTEWLTFRGSVVQNLYGQRNNQNEASLNPVAKGLLVSSYGADGKATIANSTAVNAGATLTFGNLSIDGLIGTTDESRTGTIGTGTNKGVLSLDNLLTTVGINYKF